MVSHTFRLHDQMQFDSETNQINAHAKDIPMAAISWGILSSSEMEIRSVNFASNKGSKSSKCTTRITAFDRNLQIMALLKRS